MAIDITKMIEEVRVSYQFVPSFGPIGANKYYYARQVEPLLDALKNVTEIEATDSVFLTKEGTIRMEGSITALVIDTEPPSLVEAAEAVIERFKHTGNTKEVNDLKAAVKKLKGDD